MRRRSPWADIADRDDIHVRIAPLPPGYRGACRPTPHGHWIIVLDVGLDQRARTAVLAHELGHIARGIAHDPLPGMIWREISAREERTVDRLAADLLVPPGALDEWIRTKLLDDQAVDAELVATEWDVALEVAELALGQASDRARARPASYGRFQPMARASAA